MKELFLWLAETHAYGRDTIESCSREWKDIHKETWSCNFP